MIGLTTSPSTWIIWLSQYMCSRKQILVRQIGMVNKSYLVVVQSLVCTYLLAPSYHDWSYSIQLYNGLVLYLLTTYTKKKSELEMKICNCFGELQKGPLDSGTLIGTREKDLVILHDIFVIYMRSQMNEVFQETRVLGMYFSTNFFSKQTPGRQDSFSVKNELSFDFHFA